MHNKIYNSLMGFVVGDSLGAALEFLSKEQIEKLGKYDIKQTSFNQSVVGWTDDSSLMLGLVETINENGLDFNLYSQKMVRWLFEGYLTPNGKAVGVGKGTFFSVGKLKKGASFLTSGESGINSNGNGSLMRILPLVFYLKCDKKEKYNIVKTCSAITHAHDISKIACCIYTEYFWQLMEVGDKIKAYKNMQNNIKEYFLGNPHMEIFANILNENIYDKPYNTLSGEGYVVSTLEVVLHCFINHTSFSSCVLSAINVGGDTDTNAAITAALAGYYYNEVPVKWEQQIVKHEMIENLILEFISKCENNV